MKIQACSQFRRRKSEVVGNSQDYEKEKGNQSESC